MPPKRAKVVRVKKKGGTWTTVAAARRRKAPYRAKAVKINKKTMAKSRRAFEEVKKYTHEQLAIDMGVTPTQPYVDNVSNPTVLKAMVQNDPNQTASRAKILPMWSFYTMKQGFDTESVIGEKRNNKYCTCKLVFNFPTRVQLDNPRYYLIQMWVTQPFQATNFTNPAKKDVTRNQFLTHLSNMVSEYFDEDGKREFVNFNPIETKHFKIVSYRRIVPKMNEQEINPVAGPLTSTTVNPQVFGKPSPQNHTFTWKMKPGKQAKFTKGDSLAGPLDFYYLNDSWLPLIVYYSPDSGTVSAGTADRVGVDNSPFIYYNDCTWWTD